MKRIISDEQAMQEGKESFQTNKEYKNDKNRFRRTGNARMTRIISNE
jgi:hypothetical protein